METKPKSNILYGILAGIVIGGMFGWFAPEAALKIKFLGDLFLKLLFMLVVPLIFVTMVHGITQFGDVRKMGRPATVVLIYYFTTTFISVGIGILLVTLIHPGSAGTDISGALSERVQAAAARDMTAIEFMEEMLQNIVPKNIFKSMADMQVLPLIFFSLFFGAVLTTTGKKAKKLIDIFDVLNETIIKMVQVVMKIAPVGIGCIVAGKLGSVGGGEAFVTELAKLAKYATTVILGLLVHAVIVLPLILYFFSRRNPLKYAAAMMTPLTTAFSTASSAATLPITINSVKKQGISDKTSGFVLPLGATINMDGTAMYEAVAVIFIAQCYGVDLTGMQLVTIFFTATLAGVGAAAIPEAGLVTMVIVLTAVGLPIEGISLILVIDWFLDRCRTTVNVWGDTCGAAVVEKFLNLEKKESSKKKKK
ncbi:dicarboxylate/amino acid:cation symporter [bacterium]